MSLTTREILERAAAALRAQKPVRVTGFPSFIGALLACSPRQGQTLVTLHLRSGRKAYRYLGTRP